MLSALPPLKDIITQYQLYTKKSLGQHFLFDLNITDKIVRFAGDLRNSTVIEIGPGPGGLTRSILRAGVKKLIAIEQDDHCVRALTDYLVPASEGRLEIVHGDALKVNPHELIVEEEKGTLKIIANLPYNIGTALLFKWLDYMEYYGSFTLMFQKEVADRLVAPPCSKSYGRSSVMMQTLCDVSSVYDIPARAFMPPPKVVSSVIHATPKTLLPDNRHRAQLSLLCKTVFEQRRKTLRKTMRPLTEEAESLLQHLGLEPTTRPDALSVEDFNIIAAALLSASEAL